MKIGIIGHTGLLGSALYEEFSKDHEVVGMSRSSGYDLRKNFQTILEECKTCDLVFNNAHADTCQGKIISGLINTDLKLVTSGSMAADFAVNQYCYEKKLVEMLFKKHKLQYANRCLLLKMGYLEGGQENFGFKPIKLNTVVDSVKFWLYNSRITVIEFDNVR
jgi:nucleoside-diphosphate-sugar epimerase